MAQNEGRFALSAHTAVWLLVASGLAVFANSLDGAFIYDDLSYVNESDLSLQSWEWLLSDLERPIKGRPLVGLSFVANYALGGEQVAGYHAFNIAVHVTCGLALFGVIRQTRVRFAPGAMPGLSDTSFAFACALLWMIHPLQTECVNYLSQRTESMAGLFMLAAFYCAIRSDEEVDRTRWICLAAVTSWAAALCKEIAVVGPILLVLYDLTFRGLPATALARRRWPVYLAVFSSWIPVAGLMVCLPRASTLGANADVTVAQYALNQCVVIVEYIKLIVWPSSLLVDYGRPWQASWPQVIPCAIAVVSLLLLSAFAYRRYPAVGFLGVSAALLLAPTSSLIPVNTEVGAERRMYLPLAAVSVLCVAGICVAADRCCRRFMAMERASRTDQSGWLISTVACLLLSLLAVPLAARTIRRNDDYRSPIRLWTQAVEQRPDNHRAWGNLALEWQQFDRSTGARVFQSVLERWPDDTIAQFEVASHHFDQGSLREAIGGYRRVSGLDRPDPTQDEATRRLVWLLAACDEDELRNGPEALRLAQRLVERYPNASQTLEALAAAQAECGDFANATKTMQMVVSKSLQRGGTPPAQLDRLSLYRQGKPYRLGETAP